MGLSTGVANRGSIHSGLERTPPRPPMLAAACAPGTGSDIVKARRRRQQRHRTTAGFARPIESILPEDDRYTAALDVVRRHFGLAVASARDCQETQHELGLDCIFHVR